MPFLVFYLIVLCALRALCGERIGKNGPHFGKQIFLASGHGYQLFLSRLDMASRDLRRSAFLVYFPFAPGSESLSTRSFILEGKNRKEIHNGRFEGKADLLLKTIFP